MTSPMMSYDVIVLDESGTRIWSINDITKRSQDEAVQYPETTRVDSVRDNGTQDESRDSHTITY